MYTPMSNRKRANVELVAILEERNVDGKYNAIIERARNNGYHDFKFDNIPDHPEYADCICPITQLSEDLRPFKELNDLYLDVIKGVYDAPADAEDDARMERQMIADGMPKSVRDIILGEKEE